jgi:transposase-like protein
MEKGLHARIRRSQRDYSLAFKLDIVSQVEKGELTYKQAQKKYGIQGRSTVLVWLRKLGTLDWDTIKASYQTTKEMTPEQRIKELETLLQQEKDRNLVYKTMIDIFEKEHGSSAKKKSLPKPSTDSVKPKK